MRIEDVGSLSLAQAPTSELKTLRFKFMQVFDRYHGAGSCSPIMKMDWSEFMTRYVALRYEMYKRRLPISQDPAIERFLIKSMNEKTEWDPAIMVASITKKLTPAQQKEYDKETALIAENAKKPGAQRVHKFSPGRFTFKNGHPRCLVCGDEEPISGICNKMGKAGQGAIPVYNVPEPETDARKAEDEMIQSNRNTPEGKGKHKFFMARFFGWNDKTRCLICGDPEPMDGTCPGSSASWDAKERAITPAPSVFLADVAKAAAEQFPIYKPETTATLQRIPVAPIPKGHEVRTMEISAKDGISALYDVTGKRIVTYLFDNTKFTMAEARAWIDSHTKKPTKKEESLDGEMLFKIMKKDPAQQIVGGVVYEPNAVDSQGDFTDAKEITKTMYRFMEKYGTQPQRIKVMHKGKAYFFPILECFQPEEDTTKGGDKIKAGAWWLMIKVTDPKVWSDVESGALTGFSMGGMARQG
jgi:hypothetical protein